LYIAAHNDKFRDRTIVWERTPEGRRVKAYKNPYYFYVPSKTGDFLSLKDEPLKRMDFDSKAEFEDACRRINVRFESDISPMEKVLMDEYSGKPAPNIVYGLLDIEVDYDPTIGFSNPANPYAPINAVTIYRSDLGKFLTYAVPPKSWNWDTDTLPDDISDMILFHTERELLLKMLGDIEMCDVLSGWNSEFFDLPYIGKRIEKVLGPSAFARLAFEEAQKPYWSEVERFKGAKTKELCLELGSRVHMDYMRLFKKFNLAGRPSFALAAIAADELDIPKLSYEGTLADLYNNDFILFLKYNRRDTEILEQLEKKFKYIQLANNMVHEATVNFNSIFGSVQLIDTAIINFAHNVLKRIVFDRKHKPGEKVEGALVMTPKVGLHKWVGSCDLNSLYPTIYRSLNLSPEKIIGQFTGYESDWRAIYNARLAPEDSELRNETLTLVLEDDNQAITATVGEFIDLFNTSKYAVSAYGTVLDQSSGEGLIAAVLSYWFKGRKELQAKKKEFAKKARDILKNNGGNKEDPEYIEASIQEEYFDMAQGIRKVLLNSSYGATLNEYCRFHDPRLGASTTGSGRQVTTHMINTISELVYGENAPRVVKRVSVDNKGETVNDYSVDITQGLGPIYSDTDSCYFTMANLVNNTEDAIAAADAIVDQVNDSFTGFMRTAFMCQPEHDSLMKAAREVVAESGIFRAKKKYLLYVRNMEGVDIDPDSTKALKTQGSDIKLSSTPQIIKDFLYDVTMMVLKGKPKADIDSYVIEFRKKLTHNENLNILDFATITSVKNLEEYYMKWERIEKAGLGKVNLPSNVRSTINHNEMIKEFNDKETLPIISGNKIYIVWLKENEFGLKSMAFSSDTVNFPKWFNEHFEVDKKATEDKMIDGKLSNIFDAIGWAVPTNQSMVVNSLLSF
jgi:DNA polymerase elongation subunit (family B)